MVVDKGPVDGPRVGSVGAPQLDRESMIRVLLSRAVIMASRASVDLPPIPDMIDVYLTVCERLCTYLGGDLADEEVARIGRRLKRRLAEGRTASTPSIIRVWLVVAPGGPVQIHVVVHAQTREQRYAIWRLNTWPLFGTQPDARVWALANEAADPATHRVLDIGAGTGRNALALARRGHPVDTVEVNQRFADEISAAAQAESLDVCVIAGDVFATMDELRRDYQLILLSEVVSDFLSTQQLRSLFELAGDRLPPGGRLVFNAFLVGRGCAIDQAVREFGQHFQTSIFTRDEMEAAAAGLPLKLVADDAVYDYEKTHLPHGAWPPTDWYADWIAGRNAFPIDDEISPIEMRWLVFQRTR